MWGVLTGFVFNTLAVITHCYKRCRHKATLVIGSGFELFKVINIIAEGLLLLNFFIFSRNGIDDQEVYRQNLTLVQSYFNGECLDQYTQHDFKLDLVKYEEAA